MGTGFLSQAEHSADVQTLYDEDLEMLGFVMNASRLWAYQPTLWPDFFSMLGKAMNGQGLSVRDRGILVIASVSTLGDSYCSIAWAKKLSDLASTESIAGVLRGDDTGLTARERALANWARKVVRDPNQTAATDVQELRDVGFSDAQIFATTFFVVMRMGFAAFNDALGATPDAGFRALLPSAVLDAVTYGRPLDSQPD